MIQIQSNAICQCEGLELRLAPQGATGEVILAEGFDIGEVGLADAQQSDHGEQHIRVAGSRAWLVGERLRIGARPDLHSLQNRPGQRQARVGDLRFVRLGKYEFDRLHDLTSGATTRYPWLYPNRQ